MTFPILKPNEVPTREEQTKCARDLLLMHIHTTLRHIGARGEAVWVPPLDPTFRFVTSEVIADVLDKYREHWDITEGAGGWKFAPKPSP
jgi:hypothetical protein